MTYNPSSVKPTSYPSPAEVKIYIGGQWVDDAYRVDYNVSTPRTPLYDYTSKFYRAVAEGHTLVQGQIIINYRFPNYLATALNKNLFRDPKVIKTLNESLELFRDMAEGNSEDKVRKLIELKRLGALKPAKQVAQTLYTEVPNLPGIPLDSTAKAETTVLSQRDILPFNLSIRYGGEEAVYSHNIEDCIIIGEGQVISAAAMAGGDLSASSLPIYEVYNFFGKKVTATIDKKFKANFGPVERIVKADGSNSI